ncbi:MAG: putative lipid II flippase FtsW [Actinomycetes bacterium]
MSDRRRAAFERAQLARSKGTRPRSRYREKIGKGPKPLGFYMIAAMVFILVAFGLVMVLSASSIYSFNKEGTPWNYFSRQVFFAGIGLLGMALATTFPLTWFQKHTKRFPSLTFASILPMFGVALMLLAFLPGIGTKVNGARAWIHFGSQTFQPSELMKLFIIIFGADLLSRREAEMGNLRRTMSPFLIVTSAGAGLAMIQSDVGSCLVMLGIAAAVLFLAGAPLRPMLALAAGATPFALLFIRSSPEKLQRFTSFLDIYGTRADQGYQVYQSMISLSNGGLTGTGIGTGSGKWGYVPLAHSDFIFAVLAEEMGLLGVLGLVTLFAFLIYFGLQVALSCRYRFGLLLAGGIASWFLLQLVINVGGVIGLLPVTGLTLPFISFGGTSLIVSMVACGLMMNVARRPR